MFSNWKHVFVILSCMACAWQPNSKHRYRVIFGDGDAVANGQGITEAVHAATSDWQYATGNFITFTYDPFEVAGEGTITVWGIDQADLDKKPLAASNAIGETYWHQQNSDVWVSDDLDGDHFIPYNAGDEDYLRRLATHEMGHAIGLQHTGMGTIMYHTLDSNGSYIITCADVQQVCERWSGAGEPCDASTWPACQANNELQQELPQPQQ